MNEQELEILTKLRGMFPNNLHLGGSHAQKKFLFDTPHITPNDIDIFYIGSRPMEKWAMNHILSIHFNIIASGKSYDGNYLIPKQYAFYKLADKSSGLHVDLIFVEEYIPHSGISGFSSTLPTCGSTLGEIIYSVDYGPNVLKLRYAEHAAFAKREVYYTDDVCTDDHKRKLENRCKNLGLRLVKKIKCNIKQGEL